MSSINQNDIFTVAIVGAGFSGTMAAVRLLEGTKKPLSIVLIEKCERFAKGAAYSTLCSEHLLNVPASGMSAYQEKPEHFLNWLRKRDASVKPGTFARRMVYGEYLEAQLNEAIAKAGESSLKKVCAEVVAATVDAVNDKVFLRLKDGHEICANKVIVTAGNFAPAHPKVADMSFYDSPLYIANPWTHTQAGSDKSILIIGTGLTMIDKVLELKAQGYDGIIYATSRHGLLPRPHQYNLTSLPLPIDHSNLPASARLAVAKLRQLYKNPKSFWGKAEVNWRQVVDSIRPVNQLIWQQWSMAEKKRFQRHLRHYWDVLRHRIAPEIAQILDDEIKVGKLVIYPGRIESYTTYGDRVRVAIRSRQFQKLHEVEVERVINCTGPSCNYDNISDSLIKSLRDAGLLNADACHIGIDVASNKALLSKDGVASQNVFTLGPPLKGLLWESIAVPELRGQAKEVADEILSALSPTPVASLKQ